MTNKDLDIIQKLLPMLHIIQEAMDDLEHNKFLRQELNYRAKPFSKELERSIEIFFKGSDEETLQEYYKHQTMAEAFWRSFINGEIRVEEDVKVDQNKVIKTEPMLLKYTS